MNCSIAKISTVIPSTQKPINIELNGKNLIFVGGNGAGKTQLLKRLFQDLERRIINLENNTAPELQAKIDSERDSLSKQSKTSPLYEIYEKQILELEDQLSREKNCSISIKNIEEYIINYQEHKSLALIFDAYRQAQISESTSAKNVRQLISTADNKRDTPLLASLFEEYLVSLKTKQAYAASEDIDNDPDTAEKIGLWFKKLENDLKLLFEDNSISLSFQSENASFLINQKGKSSYRLQNLSSGFSSILAIYAELLMRVELRSVSPEQLQGVVLIDEIDAHLHVSLQRKIFSFLTSAFPYVQFIITTHSPFVVASVQNAIIYDLSENQEVDELSKYSYESIIEGLFNTPTISDVLIKKIERLDATAKRDPQIEELEPLIEELSPHESHLDSQSNYFLQKAKTTLNKLKSKIKG